MVSSRLAFLALVLALLLLTSQPIPAEEGASSKYRPLEAGEMKQYEKVTFDPGKFESVTKGMTEQAVLSLLGKPLDIKMEHRTHNRWTTHYSYPNGYVVNFRNGLVVGTEKK